MNRVVVVTGASGFIGRHSLAPLIANGYEVHALYANNRLTVDGVQWHRIDLLEPRAVRDLLSGIKPTHLIHFAWYAVPADYRESLENLRWCAASMELLKCFAESGGRRAVLAGSCFEYDVRFGFCSEEHTPSAPSTFYGTCKNGLRQVAEAFSQRAAISAAWGRIFYLYGPHEPGERLVPSVTRALLAGEVARCTHGRQLRDYLHVQDVADAFVALLGSDVESVVNIGSGEPVSVRSLVTRIAKQFTPEGRVDFEALRPAPGDPPVVFADVRKLHDSVGWKPRRSLEEGLADTIEWWRGVVSTPAQQQPEDNSGAGRSHLK